MGIEHRLTTRMIGYWNLLKGEQYVPSIETFNHNIIQDLWPNCIRIAVYHSNNAISYSYEYVGDEIAKVLGKYNLGDRMSSKMAYLPMVKILAGMDRSVAHPLPLIEEGQFITTKSKIVKYRSCLLPFGKNQDNISHFVVGFSWRVF
jgi:hypothetical protein